MPTLPERAAVHFPFSSAQPLPADDLTAPVAPLAARVAAEKGVDWLMATRNADGAWSNAYPVAVSALALSAALDDPRMISDPPFRAFWEATLLYLLHAQERNDYLSRAAPTHLPYEHAVATRALCAALSTYRRAALEEAAQRAVQAILDGQQAAGGWHYGYAQGRQRTTPLTALHVEVLALAARQGILVSDCAAAVEKAILNLEAQQDPISGRFGYLHRGIGTPVMNGYALYALQSAGHGWSPAARAAWEDAAAADPFWPRSLTHPFFAAYFNHLAAYHQGGLPWMKWAPAFFAELLPGQQADGSWPPAKAEALYGPVYATALAVGMLHATDGRPRLNRHYARTPPGPLYHKRKANGNHLYLLISVPIPSPDHYVLDTHLADVAANVDRLWVEGEPRRWMHAIDTRLRAASPAPDDPLPREWKQELNRRYAVATPHGVLWDHIPPAALAFWVWGTMWEEAGRTFSSTVEQQLAARLRHGKRPQAIVPDDLYANQLSALTETEGRTLLAHALSHTAPSSHTWLDQLADAWIRADASRLAVLLNQFTEGHPAARPILERFFSASHAQYERVLRAEHAQEGDALIVCPAWLAYAYPTSLLDGFARVANQP